MKIVLLFALLAVAYAIPTEDVVQTMFIDYMRTYSKLYSTDSEFQLRYTNFKESLRRSEELQASSTSAVFGVTKFSDMSTDEFKNTILMQPITPKEHAQPPHSLAGEAAPTSFDWRDKGMVTAVKDQGQCGSCWAFSATEAIESAWIMKGHATKTTINLSPQQIVDCDTIDGVQGCNGGYTESAYDYIKQAGGQEEIANYPYTAKNGKCDFRAQYVDAKISGYTPISKDETALMGNVANIGPLSICLDAAKWQDYRSGVMTNTQCCGAVPKCVLDHCVQLVGYNSTASMPYWIVRNSWNTNWGIEGYIWLEMNKNTCGLTDDITWPTSM